MRLIIKCISARSCAAGVVAFYSNWEEIFVFSGKERATRVRERMNRAWWESLGAARYHYHQHIQRESHLRAYGLLIQKCMHMHLFPTECAHKKLKHTRVRPPNIIISSRRSTQQTCLFKFDSHGSTSRENEQKAFAYIPRKHFPNQMSLHLLLLRRRKC